MKIKSIKKIGKKDVDVYNLHIKKNHNYIANSIVVSNCHDVRGKQFNKIVSKLNKVAYRYGFTGTLPKSKIDVTKIIGSLGPHKKIIDTKTLIEKGHATPVYITFIHFLYDRHYVPFYKKWHDENDYIRNKKDRIKFISKLAASKSEKSENSILFVNDIKYKSNEIYRENIINCGIDKEKIILLKKNMKSDEFIKLKEKLEKDSGYIVITTYQLASVGISIKNLHNLIMAQPIGRGNIKILQTIGRGIRKHHNKEKVNIYDFVDNIKYSLKHYHVRKSYYEEQNFNIKEIKIKL